MNFKTIVRNSYPYRILRLWQGFIAWGKGAYSAPSPHFIKQTVLLRNAFPSATWVETGTYLGQTTKELSKHGAFVYSIEPEPTL